MKDFFELLLLTVSRKIGRKLIKPNFLPISVFCSVTRLLLAFHVVENVLNIFVFLKFFQ